MQSTKEPKAPLRIVICEDHPLLSDAITTLLSNVEDFEVVVQAKNAAEGLNAVRDTKPDLIVLDLSLPDRSGFELLRDLRAQNGSTKVLAFSMHEDSGTVRRLRDGGAEGYLSKAAGGSELIDTLRRVAKGEVVFPANTAGVSGRTARPHDLVVSSNDPLDPLSKREREIFYLLIEGLPNRVIAQRLFISPRTIETHRARVIRKLGCCSTADLIRYAIRNSLTSA